MKLAAQPMPHTSRAITNVMSDVANACMAAPMVIRIESRPTVRRGPMRSNATPTATCATSRLIKKLPLASPNMRGDKARSRISSGAITASAVRKNCDRIVVAASRATRRRMSRGRTGCTAPAAGPSSGEKDIGAEAQRGWARRSWAANKRHVVLCHISLRLRHGLARHGRCAPSMIGVRSPWRPPASVC
jgi:hypothetical protein